MSGAGLAIVVALAAAVPDSDVTAWSERAKAAAAEKRYCDALVWFDRLSAATGEAKYLYNAGEVAYAADDRLRALQVYRDLLVKFPDFERAAKVQERIAGLGAAIAKDGVGQTCPAPTAVCGDGFVEAGEQCDDGNVVDGDGCSAKCTLPICGDGVKDPGEQCDDGNVVGGDGCSAACAIEVKPIAVETKTAPVVVDVVKARAPKATPLAPWLVAGGGGVLALAGVVATGVAVWPAIDFEMNRGQQDVLETRFDGGDASALVAARTLNQRLVDDRARWNAWGIPTACAGVVGLVAGGAALVAGAVWANAADDEQRP